MLRKTTLSLTLTVLALPLLSWGNVITPPEVHGYVALDGKWYFGEDDPDQGFQVPDNQIVLRQASVEVIGNLGAYFHYNAEVGALTCPGGYTGPQARLLEAGVFFTPFNSLTIGLSKGHFLKGFELRDECLNVLTLEKPRFAPTFATCHPIGLVIGLDHNFTENTGLEVELAFLNGPSGTIDEEYDANIGLIFRTPLPGLSVGGYFNPIKTDFELDGSAETGQRYGFGASYNYWGILAQGEYYFLEGAYSNYAEVTSEELKMRAFYVQGGYRIDLPMWEYAFVFPLVMYQHWDQGQNVDGDQVYSYATVGATLGFQPYEDYRAEVKLGYELPVSEPEGTYEQEKRFVARFMVSF